MRGSGGGGGGRGGRRGGFSPAAAPQEALSVVVELTLCLAVEPDDVSHTKLTRQSEPKKPSLNGVGPTAHLHERGAALTLNTSVLPLMQFINFSYLD